MRVLEACEQYDIAFIALPPNSTHLLQPLDVALFRPVKAAWRKVLKIWKDSPSGRKFMNIPKSEFPGLLKKLLEALEARLASNIAAGFRKSGLCPLDVLQPMSRLPQSLLAADHLIQKYVSDVFVEAIAETREQTTVTPKGRAKRVNIAPGKSISASEVAQMRDAAEQKKEAEKAEKQAKKAEAKAKKADEKARKKIEKHKAVRRKRRVSTSSSSSEDLDDPSIPPRLLLQMTLILKRLAILKQIVSMELMRMIRQKRERKLKTKLRNLQQRQIFQLSTLVTLLLSSMREMIILAR